MPKGGRPRNKELWNVVLASVRVLGPNFTKVARQTGVHRGTVRNLWEKGWPDREGCLPLKQVLNMDALMVRAARAGADPEAQVDVAQQVLAASLGAAKEDAKDAADMLGKAAQHCAKLEARALAILAEAEKKLVEVEDLSRAKVSDAEKAAMATLARAEIQAKERMSDLLKRAKVDAAETLADEAQGAKFGRKAAMAAVAIAALVLKDAQVIATQLRAAMGDLSKLKPMEAIRITREMVRLVESAEKSLILALQAERLRLGQPTEVLGITGMDASLDEKEIKLKAVQRALAKQRAKLSLVPGGVTHAVGEAGNRGTGSDGAAGPGGLAGGQAP